MKGGRHAFFVGSWLGVLGIASAMSCDKLIGIEAGTPFPPDAPVDAEHEATDVDDVGEACSVDTSTDPKNCGACGHDCLRGACKEGACQPFVLFGEPNGFDFITFADGTFYWVTTIADGSVSRVLRRRDVDGETSSDLVRGDESDFGFGAPIAVDRTHVYFYSDFRVVDPCPSDCDFPAYGMDLRRIRKDAPSDDGGSSDGGSFDGGDAGGPGEIVVFAMDFGTSNPIPPLPHLDPFDDRYIAIAHILSAKLDGFFTLLQRADGGAIDGSVARYPAPSPIAVGYPATQLFAKFREEAIYTQHHRLARGCDAGCTSDFFASSCWNVDDRFAYSIVDDVPKLASLPGQRGQRLARASFDGGIESLAEWGIRSMEPDDFVSCFVDERGALVSGAVANAQFVATRGLFFVAPGAKPRQLFASSDRIDIIGADATSFFFRAKGDVYRVMR